MDEQPTAESAGDSTGVGEDLESYGRRLEEQRQPALRFACRLLGDAHDAEEAVQEAFMRLLKALGQFGGRSSFRTYVLAAVRNSCLDRWRKRLTSSGRLREINPTTTAFFRRLPQGGRFVGVSTQLERRESQEIVRAAIDSLPERQRACMVLRDLEGLPYREVAQVLGITANHVGVLLYHARIGLRKLIEEGGLFGGD